MTTATVEGVDIDLRHWIGGERVASAATFADVSPIDETVIAEVARRRGRRDRRRSDRRPAGFPGLGRTAPGRARRPAPRRRRRGRCPGRGIGSGRDPGQRFAAAVASARRDAAGRQQLPLLRRLPGTAGTPGRARSADTGERVTHDPAGVTAIITPWNAPLMLATWRIGPGAGRRQHGGRQAAGVGAVDRVAAGRHHRRGRPAARGVQRGPGHRRRRRGHR